ncbi:hypothetical protein Clacol_007574 [Clathrus columnatus]|uniref:D-arabinono-1,4-lactone oxidase C-terminal domain-containing protein n=1 Tax=Clathrus columnatus TaxID=1419009 RepID=A0AAV5AFA9_9AGAM|nr:hypothetical protein Clacol_007574 [Clathrus columnatus]
MQLPLLSSLWNADTSRIAWDYFLSGVAKSIVIMVHTAHFAVDLTAQGLQVGNAYMPTSLMIYLPKLFSSDQVQIEQPKAHVPGSPYNTYDGPGFPACHSVAQIHHPSTVDEIVGIVRDVIKADNGTRIRASGPRTTESLIGSPDDPNTIIIRTDGVNTIRNLNMNGDEGTVDLDPAGSIATGAHRSSLSQDSQVSSAAVELDILNGEGDLIQLKKDDSDDWLAATASLGLLGIITRVKLVVVKDFKVYANQTILEEEEVLNGDIYALIAPYVTANLWWWPGQRRFHQRTYNVVPVETEGNAFQSTFSVTPLEGYTGRTLLDMGQDVSWPNFLAEKIFYDIWCAPNFHDKITNKPLKSWPVYGWAYDVLIGGLYPQQLPEWDYDIHGRTYEIAVPVTQANALLKRIRELFDEAAAQGKPVTTTYRSGINIKFGKSFDSFLGQTTERVGEVKADWSKGAIMFDFPMYQPRGGDHHLYHQEFFTNLARVLADDFPSRPHWSKNTREVLRQTVKNLDNESLQRFSKVRERFDPKRIYHTIVAEIINV